MQELSISRFSERIPSLDHALYGQRSEDQIKAYCGQEELIEDAIGTEPASPTEKESRQNFTKQMKEEINKDKKLNTDLSNHFISLVRWFQIAIKTTYNCFFPNKPASDQKSTLTHIQKILSNINDFFQSFLDQFRCLAKPRFDRRIYKPKFRALVKRKGESKPKPISYKNAYNEIMKLKL